MMDDGNDKNILIKELLYKSNHRGCKETDIIFGKFAKKLHILSDENLMLYKALLEEDDADIYSWICETSICKNKYTDIIKIIKND